MSVQLPPLPVLKETAGVISAPFTLDGGPSALDEPILLSSPEGNEVLENEDNVPNDNAESSEDEIEEESLLDKEKKRLEEEGRNAVLGLRPTETLEEK